MLLLVSRVSVFLERKQDEDSS